MELSRRQAEVNRKQMHHMLSDNGKGYEEK